MQDIIIISCFVNEYQITWLITKTFIGLQDSLYKTTKYENVRFILSPGPRSLIPWSSVYTYLPTKATIIYTLNYIYALRQ